ncbi:MAG: carbohydrate kinase family protein [Opitutales bacterium]
MSRTPPPGVLAAGHWIVDHVKRIDHYPEENALATIGEQAQGNGGCAYNLLKNLARLGASFPLRAAGLVGNDADGRWILDDCCAHGIDTTQLRVHSDAPTSYTDVMTVGATGRRTFFHQPGANARLTEADVELDAVPRHFHLGYLMLLDGLDRPGDDGLSGAARLLRAAREKGAVTSVDFVTVDHPEFAAWSRCALPLIDVLIANEAELARLTQMPAFDPGDPVLEQRLVEGARQLIDAGVQRWVVVHYEGGAVAVSSGGAVVTQPAVKVPSEAIRGAAGAGDGFAAGLLLGLHESCAMAECLRWAVSVAAISLHEVTCSEAIGPLSRCLAQAQHYGFRS